MMEEAWKDIEGHEGIYVVSSFGSVRSCPRNILRRNGYPQTVRGRRLKQDLNKSGYKVVMLGIGTARTSYLVHRLVAKAFVPNPYNKPTVNHIDGNKLNNHYRNFEWATRQEQTTHAVNLGLMNNRGENSGKTTLTWLQVGIIRECVETGYLQKNVAKYFNIHHTTVQAIIKNRRWVI